MNNTQFHDVVANLLPRWLYMITSKLNKLEYNYDINLIDNVDEYKMGNLPYWAESLYQMSYYTSFGPTFSTLSLTVSDQVYQDYLYLEEDTTKTLDSLMEKHYE